MSDPNINILGISAYYHDSAACLVRNGEIVAAAQEDAGFPRHALDYCLHAGGITAKDLNSTDPKTIKPQPPLKPLSHDRERIPPNT